jgi:hypothetical protein
VLPSLWCVNDQQKGRFNRPFLLLHFIYL